MAYAALRTTAILHDSGWPTTPQEALWDSIAAAKTTILDDTLVLYGFDFSDLPASILVRGIGLRVDGLKDHAGGSGTLRLGLELSWDGGSGWTSPIKKTALLELVQRTFVVGTPQDTWGRSWTRAELATANSFRVRISASYDSVVANPTWHLAYLTAAVFYEENPSLVVDIDEPLEIFETVTASIDAVLVRERISVSDSGSAPFGTGIPNRETQHLKLSGSAITGLESDSDFTVSAARPKRREGIGILLQIDVAGPSFFIGDTVLTLNAPAALYPASMMQPGLLGIGEIVFEADFLGGASIPSIECSVMNRKFVDQTNGASPTPKTIAEHCAGKSVVGRVLKAWAFVESGDGWKKRVIFNGQVEEIEFREHEVVVRGVQLGTSGKVVPDIVVDENLFSFDAATERGEQIEGNRGKVVPVGIGRFDYGAVKKPADFAAGHPFRANFESGPPSEHAKNYTNIALFPAMLGLKHPMLPTIHAARNYRRVVRDGSGENSFTSFPYQNVFLYGSRKSSPHLYVGVGPPDSIKSDVFPGVDASGGYSVSSFHALDYVTAWTWHRDAGMSVGVPFVAPRSKYYFISEGSPFVPTFALNQCGARPMERLGNPTPTLQPDWSDGTAAQAFGLFANFRTPRLKAVNLQKWPGVMQAIALPMAGPTTLEFGTRVSPRRGFDSPVTPVFRTIEGTGQGFVENLKNCLDADLENATRLQNMGYLSLQCPIDGPGLGKILGIRLCVLWNHSSSTAQNVYLMARMGPHRNYAIQESFYSQGADWNRDFGAVHDETHNLEGSGVIPVFKLANVAGTPFASVWLLPNFDVSTMKANVLFTTDSQPIHQEPGGTPIPGIPAGRVDVTFHPLRKGHSEWQFTSMDPNNPHLWLEWSPWPWDFMLHVRDETGGVPDANRWLDLVSVWLEVVFESPINYKSNDYEFVVPFIDAGIVYNNPPMGWYRAGQRDVTFSFPRRATTPPGLPDVYVTGKGPTDDASGGITGTAGKIVENPADAAALLIRHYLGDSVFSARASGSAYGSFANARTLLGTDSYRESIVLTEAETIGAVMNRIASQSKALVMERLGDNGELQWVFLIDGKDPEIDDPARMYRADGYYFRWNDIAAGSFSVRQTPIEDIRSTVRLRYGFHIPTRSWSSEKFVTPDSSNFSSSAAAYTAAMASARKDFRATKEVTVDAPDVWDPAVAETLCKWYADRLSKRYALLEFETYINAADLQPGHVIKMHDELQERVPFPGVGLGGGWSVHQFSVIQTAFRQDSGQLAKIYVKALQTFKAAA